MSAKRPDGEEERDDDLVELQVRIDRAIANLTTLRDSTDVHEEKIRLSGKIAGLALAGAYLNDTLRIREQS